MKIVNVVVIQKVAIAMEWEMYAHATVATVNKFKQLKTSIMKDT